MTRNEPSWTHTITRGSHIRCSPAGPMGTVVAVERGETPELDVYVVTLDDGRWASVPRECAELAPRA